MEYSVTLKYYKSVSPCSKQILEKIYIPGETISLSPSIGNWNFACQSHYFIRKSKIEFARIWSSDEINDGIKKDEKKKKSFFFKRKKKRK